MLHACSGVEVPDKYWTAAYPKAGGDILALAACVMNSEGFKTKLKTAKQQDKRTKYVSNEMVVALCHDSGGCVVVFDVSTV